ncbi:MAG: hypothetical protein A2X46_00040 [Lentisphaerae bacterium GWF2_57_35]|nr:MAG: hypothetical protein A2X46_00040 [Lentisphaerae bacterium GWF2_57_35]
MMALAGAILLSGCGGAGAQDRREERDPLLKRAQARKNTQDIDGAIDLFQKALERKPTLARAHLELALIYDQSKGDYIRAIYHYQRYLEMRPDAEKKDLIQDLIRHARLAYAASLPDQPSGAIQEITLLKKEIDSLRAQLARQSSPPVSSGTPKSTAPSASASSTAPAAAKPQPAQPPVQTYVVQSGDTLSSISSKMYRDPTKWKVIYEANRGTLASPQSVRAGQTLMIPRLP